MRTLLHDLRYGARMLRKSPGFTVVAVVTLALGIGANTAIFSVMDRLMFRMLPVRNPEELFTVAQVSTGGTDDRFSHAAFLQFREGTRAIAGITAASTAQRENIIIGGEPELVDRKAAAGNYFSLLGVPALIGRTLTEDDDRLPPGNPVAVVSYGYWQRRFGGDAAVLGRTFTLKGSLFTIVGVTPSEFFGETVGEAPDVWTPITAQPMAPAWLWSGHSTTWLRIMGRRNPGVTREQARAGVEIVFRRIRDDIAGRMENPVWRQKALEAGFDMRDGSAGFSELRETFSRPLRVLLAVVGLVLLIACANVANLLLARAAARRREIAVRLAVGAGRWRLVRQLVTEFLLLAAIGGGFGLLVAQWGGGVLVELMSRARRAAPIDLEIDFRVLAFAAALSFVTGLMFGVAPALRATRLALTNALKDATPRIGRSRLSIGKSLIVGQAAISLVLLITAGLFVRSLQNLQSVDLGFVPESVVVFRIDPGATGYSAAQKTNLYEQLLERLQAIPGVRSASVSFFGLFGRGLWGNQLVIEGYTLRPGQIVHTFANAVSPRYFETMGISLLRGRPFAPADNQSAPKVAIVNETFGRHYFGNQTPIGRRFAFGGQAAAMMEIVGVVRDAKYQSVREEPRRMIYVPHLQYPSNLNELAVRSTADSAVLSSAIRKQIASIDRNLPVLDAATLQNQVDQSIAPEHLIGRLAACFGLLATALACIGLYGVMSHAVARRTNDIGVRLALGANPADVLGMVLRESLVLVGAGIIGGLCTAFATTRYVSRLLFGLTPTDPLTITAAVALLVTVAAIAAFLPARRAARVDPMVALRYE